MNDYVVTTNEERAAAWRATHAKAAQAELEATARPFRFEDLNGKPEPKSWGPIYSKPIAKPRAVNDETNIPTNCASGQKRCFDAAKHRAKLRAEFAAAANAERLAWALGKAKNCQGLTIKQAYALAMKAKRARLEANARPVNALKLEEAA